MKQIEPIALFRSPFTTKFGIPRQSGLVEELRGRIVFEQDYRHPDAIRGLEDFDYIWLIWGFSANKDSRSLTVRPPRLGGDERLGVFATRSPFRPNGLGLSAVRLMEISGGELIVSGADLMDGTPIYDIKPYIPYADSHADARGGFTDNRQWRQLTVVFPDELRSRVGAQADEIIRTLSLDPRPHYHDDPQRVYGMPFAGRDIKFRVDGDILTVVAVD